MDRGSYSDKQANSEEAEACDEKEVKEPVRKRK